MEYIEIFSLLAAAAERIDEGETCVELDSMSVGPVMDHQPSRDIPEQPEQPKKPGREKQPKKEGKLAAWRRRLTTLISEDAEEDDDDQ